ncbi:MAG: small basic protein [Phycisphaerae bacterium]
MSLDSTLKTSGGIVKVRNVMTRAERISVLMEEGDFDPKTDSPLGLRKTEVVPTAGPVRIDPEELDKEEE